MNLPTLPSIFNGLSDAFVLLDAEGCYRYANARAKELFGSEAGHSLVSTSFQERLLKQFGFALEDTLHNALRHHSPLMLEVRNENDGCWYELHLYPSDTGTIVLCHDITLRKNREAREQFLTELSERIHALTEAQDILKTTVQAVGAYLNVTHCFFSEIDVDNDRIVIPFDYHSEVPSIAGHYVLSHFVLPENLKRHADGQTEVVGDTRTHPHTAEAYRQHYRPHHVEAYIGVPLRRRGKWVAAFVADSNVPRQWSADEVTLMEVVAQRTWLAVENARLHQQTLEMTERSLESLALLNTFLNTTPIGLAFFDVGLRYLRLNEALAKINGVPVAEHIGRTVGEVLPDMPAHVEEDLRRVLKTGKPLIEREVIGRTPASAQTRAWLVSYYPVRTAADLLLGIGAVVVEITERKRAEESIAGLNKRLQWSLAENNHRVKNNLQVLAALIDMQVMDGPMLVPAQEFHRIATQIRALAAVHDLLTLQARDEGQTEAVSAKAMLERLLPVMQKTVGQRSLRLDVEDVPLTTKQATSLALITNELVSNAIKHGQGEVGIRFQTYGNEGILTITDEGPGFPADFDPRKAAGTGLELIERLAGWDLFGHTTYTHTEAGGGCVFVTVPLDMPRQAPAKSTGEE